MQSNSAGSTVGLNVAPSGMPFQNAVAMSGSPATGASLLMFNPQPAPSAEPALEMHTPLNDGASITLRGPDPGAAGLLNMIVITADGTESRIGINTDAPTEALYVVGGGCYSVWRLPNPLVQGDERGHG